MDSDHVIHILGEKKTDENKTGEELIRELAETRARLSAEKRHNRELTKQLALQEEPDGNTYFDLIARVANIGTFSNNLQTGTHYWSPEFLAIYGLGPDEALPIEEGIPKAIHPEDRKEILAGFHARQAGKLDSQYFREHRIMLPNKKIRWAMVRGQMDFDTNGRPLRTHGIMLDITERKQAEEALQRSAQFPEENPNPVLRWIPGGAILYVNTPARQWLTAWDWRNGESLPAPVAKAVTQALGQDHSIETEITTPDGRIFNLFAAQPPGEAYINLYGIDITQRKQAEAERLEMERRMQQIVKTESLSHMAGAVAHHFNNLLSVVLGNLEMALEDLSPEEGAAQFLAAAEDAARRAGELSRLMLLFLGQSQGSPDLLDLSQICGQLLEKLRREIPEEVTLKTDLPKPGPIIMADPARINQILTHLVTNAWESMKRFPGVVRVTVESVAGVKVPTCNRFPMEWEQSAEDYACLAVSDTGCGMTVETISRIFDPFFTEKFTGRGLGLAVTLGIVKSLDGCVTVVSAPKRGSTLRVYLPLLEEAERRQKHYFEAYG